MYMCDSYGFYVFFSTEAYTKTITSTVAKLYALVHEKYQYIKKAVTYDSKWPAASTAIIQI